MRSNVSYGKYAGRSFLAIVVDLNSAYIFICFVAWPEKKVTKKVA